MTPWWARLRMRLLGSRYCPACDEWPAWWRQWRHTHAVLEKPPTRREERELDAWLEKVGPNLRAALEALDREGRASG